MTRTNSAVLKHAFNLGILMILLASSLYAQNLKSSRVTEPQVTESGIVDSLAATRSSLSRLIPIEADEATQHPQQPVPAPTPKTTEPPPYVFPTHNERFMRFVKNTVGPFRLARTAISAGIDQWRDHPEEWGQGAQGYGKRFASDFGKNVIRQGVTYGLDEALGLDTGFRRSTRKGFWPRAVDALAENVTSRNREGKRVISVPRFAGIYAGSIIPYETWYPSRYNYMDGLRSGTRTLVIDFGLNLVREFLIKF